MDLQPIEILLIEDNPGDIELVKAGFEEARVYNSFRVISDGQAAVDFFSDERLGDSTAVIPDIILLDINLPKVNGFEVLQKIRATQMGRNIPVVILTSSDAEMDIDRGYSEHANSYITKPVDFEKFMTVIRSIGNFWFSVVRLPGKKV